MAEEIRVAAVSEIPDGKIRQYQVKDRIVAISHVGESFFATDELCTHRAGPLSEGTLDGASVTCPWHQAKFDLTNGKCLAGPGKRDLRTYPVTLKENAVWILF